MGGPPQPRHHCRRLPHPKIRLDPEKEACGLKRKFDQFVNDLRKKQKRRTRSRRENQVPREHATRPGDAGDAHGAAAPRGRHQTPVTSQPPEDATEAGTPDARAAPCSPLPGLVSVLFPFRSPLRLFIFLSLLCSGLLPVSSHVGGPLDVSKWVFSGESAAVQGAPAAPRGTERRGRRASVTSPARKRQPRAGERVPPVFSGWGGLLCTWPWTRRTPGS